MPRKKSQPAKLFSVDRANAALPLVRAITGDLVRLSRDVIERKQRLEQLSVDEREGESNNPYDAELTQFREDLDLDSKRLNEYAKELRDLGIELKSAPEGLVDFPSEMDGRLVSLCWKFDEPEVLFWHELDAGFAGRQPLTAGSIADEGTDTDGLDA